MKKTMKSIFVILLILCLVLEAFYILKTVKGRNEERSGAQIEEEESGAPEEDLSSLEEAAEDAEDTGAEDEASDEEPANPQTAEALGEWNLILVNNQNAIPEGYEIETAVAEDGYEVDSRVRDALMEMLEDCRAAGFSPQIISAFRSHELQQYLYDTTANKADTAVPGHSEHECGLAIDIIDAGSAGWGDPLIKEQEDMPAQQWLMQHCQNYGFILRYPEDKEAITEIIYEPWHYRYVGPEHAKIIMEEKICLEEYIERLNSL